MTIIEKAIQLKELIKQQCQTLEDKTLLIAVKGYFEKWTPNIYKVGDVRLNENGIPYECIMAHDSTVNTTWDISVRTLWKPYHSRKKEYALPFEMPTGAHDMYKVGEYCIFNDINIYKCIQDTSYSPSDYTQAWELVE